MIYARQKDIAEVVAEERRNLEAIKQTQIVGTDNLIVKQYSVLIGPESITTAGADFRAEFVFLFPPVDTFVNITFNYFYTGLESIEVLKVYDPDTIDSLTSQAAIFTVVPSADITDFFVVVLFKSTSPPSHVNLDRL